MALHPDLRPDMRVGPAHDGEIEVGGETAYLRLDPAKGHILAVDLQGVEASEMPPTCLDRVLPLSRGVGGDHHKACPPGRAEHVVQRSAGSPGSAWETKDRSNRRSWSMPPIRMTSTLSSTVSSAPARTLKPSPSARCPSSVTVPLDQLVQGVPVARCVHVLGQGKAGKAHVPCPLHGRLEVPVAEGAVLANLGVNVKISPDSHRFASSPGFAVAIPPR